jgi:DNA adenine methylase
MRYPGGKGKTYQRIINFMPPHRIYVESHLGGGAVLRHKQPAQVNIGIDIDPQPLEAFVDYGPDFKFICTDAVGALIGLQPTADTLIYADPPYFPTTRRRARVYRNDYSEADHEKLLHCLCDLKCMVMISGYPNALYDRVLGSWRRETFSAMSHIGLREEAVWMNFQPSVLHDIRYVGDTFRDRGALVQKRQRWRERFASMQKPIQQALLADLVAVFMGELSEIQRERMADILLTGGQLEP